MFASVSQRQKTMPRRYERGMSERLFGRAVPGNRQMKFSIVWLATLSPAGRALHRAAHRLDTPGVEPCHV